MDIPVINRIMEFETNMKALQSPSFASQVLSVSNTFMKWSALIFAVVASFTTIISRVKILIIRLQTHPSHHQTLVNDDDDYDTETESSSSLSDDDEEEVEDEEDDDEESITTTSFRADEDFSVRGSGHVYIDDQWQNCNMGLRCRRRRSIGDLFSWSELTGGKSVVKLWDNLSLKEIVRGGDSGNLFAIYDMNCEREIRRMGTVFGAKLGIPLVASSSSSPAAMVSAAANGGGLVELRGWDARIGSRSPAILAEWRPKLGHVRDDGGSALTVGDMRKVNAPLEDMTETEVDTWWDADAVVVTDEHFNG